MSNIPTKNRRPERILQFGAGNFLRAFADWMIDTLNEETDFNGNIIIVKPTERGIYKALRQQNGRFHVVLNGIENGKEIQNIRLISSINRVIHPYREWTDFLQTAEISTLRFIISNTTEAGIAFNEKDAFSEEKTPKEFPAKLTIWLYRRFEKFKGATDKGCVFLPLELIADNGIALKTCILKYALYWNLSETFIEWISVHNYFCNTLVDRIVSGYPTADAVELTKKLAFKDDLLVAGELYHNWIIQAPNFVQEALPFAKTNLNVVFTDDLAIHRQIKVRLLNGAHTAMVPIGLLAGLSLVSEAMVQPSIQSYLEDLLIKEVIPTIAYPKKDLNNFANAVFDRFKNRSIRHKLIDISLNSTSKFITRLSFTLKDYLKIYGVLPRRIVFALAALLRLYKGEINTKKLPLKDKTETLQFFEETWQVFGANYEQLVRIILNNEIIWGQNLDEIPNLSSLTAQYLAQIDKEGCIAALEIALLKQIDHT